MRCARRGFRGAGCYRRHALLVGWSGGRGRGNGALIRCDEVHGRTIGGLDGECADWQEFRRGKWPRRARIRQHRIYNRGGTAAVHGARRSRRESDEIVACGCKCSGLRATGALARPRGHLWVPLACGPVKADCEPASRRYCLPRQLKRKPRSWVPTFDSGARGHEPPAGGTVRRTERAPAFPSPRANEPPPPLDPIHDQQA